jgi:hypothetical protein
MKHLRSFETYDSLSSNPRYKLFGFLRNLGKRGYEILKRKIFSDRAPIEWHGPLPKGRIRASDAYSTKGSILTVLSGRRGVGYLTSSIDEEPRLRNLINQAIKDKKIRKVDINIIDKKDNPYKPFIIYKAEYEKEAMELKSIAERFNGYLSEKADKQTSKRIGELLGYADEDIIRYLK